MQVKTIKGIDEQTWAEFKSLAAKRRMKAGELFKTMTREYEEKGKDLWEKILTGKKILSEKEASSLLEVTTIIRKEHGFR